VTISVFTDGAARGNPGKAGIGIVIKDDSGAVLAELKKYIGISTNNNAEYTALVHALEYILGAETLRCSAVVVHTDSELMARQILGEYKVKEPGLKLMHQKVILLLKSAPFSFTIRHIPRSRNAEADALANEAIDSHTA
jgi:ribonuclease HI